MSISKRVSLGAQVLFLAAVGVAMTVSAATPSSEMEAKVETEKLNKLHYVTKDGKVVSPGEVHKEINKVCHNYARSVGFFLLC